METKSEADTFCETVTADLKQTVELVSQRFNYSFEKGEPLEGPFFWTEAKAIFGLGQPVQKQPIREDSKEKLSRDSRPSIFSSSTDCDSA